MFKAFNFSQSEREEFILFTVIVAGKNANFASKALQKFLLIEDGTSPFDKILKMISKNKLLDSLKESKTGNYHKLYNCFKQLVESDFSKDLSIVNVEQLESIKGIGPKTARYFLLHTVKYSKLAVLDTHILKWLNLLQYNVPNVTPQSRNKYLSIEKIFLKEAENRNKSAYELDLEIWTLYSKSDVPIFHKDELSLIRGRESIVVETKNRSLGV